MVRSIKASAARGPSLLLMSAALTLSAFELVFRFVIPAASLPLLEYDRTYGVVRYQISGPRTGISTSGRWGGRPVRWRINNYGWNSAIDYAPAEKRGKPLIALIGDSYIDALQVNVGESVADELRRRLAGRRDVYSFGFSGAPLSQYLQMSRYVRKVFHPDVMVFNIVYNDFDECLRDLYPRPNFLQIADGPGGLVEVQPVPYEPSALKRMAAHSALVRYLWVNLHLPEMAGTWVTREGPPARLYASVDLHKLEANRNRVERVTFELVDRIRRENPGTAILFVMDAPRLDIYAGKPGEGRLGWLHRLLELACERSGCRYVDLTGPFRDRYARDHVRFNFDDDYHWNQAGHALAAEALEAALRELPLPLPNPSAASP